MSFVILVPVLNEMHSIVEFSKELLSSISEDDIIIFIDGGSKDGSKEFLISLTNEHQNLEILSSPKGQSRQVSRGVKRALELNKKFFIQIDANGRDNPKNIDKVKNLLLAGFDIVCGSRFIEDNKRETPFYRFFLIKFVHVPICNLRSKYKWSDTTQGFRGYSEKFIKNYDFVNKYWDKDGYDHLIDISMFACKDYKCMEFSAERRYFINKKSKFISKTLFTYAFRFFKKAIFGK